MALEKMLGWVLEVGKRVTKAKRRVSEEGMETSEADKNTLKVEEMVLEEGRRVSMEKRRSQMPGMMRKLWPQMQVG